jgi:hypothetical protein
MDRMAACYLLLSREQRSSAPCAVLSELERSLDPPPKESEVIRWAVDVLRLLPSRAILKSSILRRFCYSAAEGEDTGARINIVSVLAGLAKRKDHTALRLLRRLTRDPAMPVAQNAGTYLREVLMEHGGAGVH